MQELQSRPLFFVNPLEARMECSTQRITPRKVELDDSIKHELHQAISQKKHDSTQLWSANSNEEKKNNREFDLTKFLKPDSLKFFGFFGIGIILIISLYKFFRK